MDMIRATTYGPEGSTMPGEVIYEGDSLDDARAAVADYLGVDLDALAVRRWAGCPEDGDIVAYHEYPDGHPDGYGCGGVAIGRVTAPR
jgi:hypothetical protein